MFKIPGLRRLLDFWFGSLRFSPWFTIVNYISILTVYKLSMFYFTHGYKP